MQAEAKNVMVLRTELSATEVLDRFTRALLDPQLGCKGRVRDSEARLWNYGNLSGQYLRVNVVSCGPESELNCQFVSGFGAMLHALVSLLLSLFYFNDFWHGSRDPLGRPWHPVWLGVAAVIWLFLFVLRIWDPFPLKTTDSENRLIQIVKQVVSAENPYIHPFILPPVEPRLSLLEIFGLPPSEAFAVMKRQWRF